MAGKIPSRTSKAHNAKPYDRPKSLFQKVASTLCDMFVPSWMLYDSSQKNNSNQKTEQEIVEQATPNVHQSDLNQPLPESSYIPERRPCCSSYAADLKERREKTKEYEFSSGHRNENAEENVHSSIKTDILSTSYVFQRKSSVRHPIVNGDDHSENSEGSASTSGCSSLVSSHQERRDQIHDTGLQISEEGLERISKKLTEKQLFKRRTEKRDISVETDSVCHETEGNVSTSHTPLWFEDRSLNPNKRARPQPSATGRRPSFSLSSFGAPSLSDSRNSANKSYSPFYEGKTVFGGASSNRRMQLLSSMPYQYARPQNARLNVKEATSSKKEFDYMSTTAKRILQSLEKMSTPLEDAKKIPAEGKTPIELAFAARHRMMPNVMALKRQSIRTSDRGPPTKSILLPSPTVIGKNLEPRISPSIEKKRNSDVILTESFPCSSSTIQCSSTSAGGKLKTRARASVHHSRKQDSNEVVELPDLPSIPLPVAQLPTFNFNSISKGSTKSSATVTSNGNISSQPVFTFSSPVEHNVPSSSQIPCSAEASFTFSSPVIKDKTTISTTSSSPLVQNAKYNTKEDQCCTLEPASDLIIGGSVMDVLGKSDSKETTSIPDNKSTPSDKLKEEIKVEQQEIKTDKKQDKIISGFGDKFKPEAGSWECTSCLVRNNKNADKCISCTSPKPNLNSSNTAISQTAGFKVFSTPFSSSSMKWEASAALVENKNSIKASEKSKPKNDASWQGFGCKFKPAADSWNCSTCLVNNNNSSQQCISCGTAKPQSAKSLFAGQAPLSSFGDKFKPPPGTWKCDTCFVPNSAADIKCVACETPRVAHSQIKDPKQAFSGFKFSVPEKQSTNSTPIKFGIPVTSVVSVSGTATGFKFGMPTTESKPIESLNFGTSTSNNNISSSSCVFGNKPLEKIPEPVSTNAKVQTGFSMPINSSSSSNLAFGQKPLSVSVPEKTSFKFGFQQTNQELKNTSEEVTPVSNSAPLSTTLSPSASPLLPLSSTKLSASLTTVTTTVSVFNFGKSPPIMSTTSSERLVPSSTEEGTTVLSKPNSVAFNFASTTPRSDSSLCEDSLQKTSEDTKLPLFGTTKSIVELKPDVGQNIKSEMEQKPNIVQATPSTFTATSTVPFSFGNNTKNNTGFVFGTPKTESSQGNTGGFTFSIGSGKPSDTSASGFTGFGVNSNSQAVTTSTFTFGSGTLTSNVTTTNTVTTTTTTNMFSFGAYSSPPAVSAKPDIAPQTTSAPLFSANPQISLPSFGSALSAPTFGQQSQLKQEGFGFPQSSLALRFGSTTAAPVFRFGAPQEQKPAGFSFGAGQEPEQKIIEILPRKPTFSFGFSSPQGEQKPSTVSQDSNFMFTGNSSQANEQEKPKSGFSFTFDPPQQTPVFGTALSTTTITGTVPTFNFTGNTPTAAAFSFSAPPSSTPSSSTPGSRRIKRAVRRSGLPSGRRD